MMDIEWARMGLLDWGPALALGAIVFMTALNIASAAKNVELNDETLNKNYWLGIIAGFAPIFFIANGPLIASVLLSLFAAVVLGSLLWQMFEESGGAAQMIHEMADMNPQLKRVSQQLIDLGIDDTRFTKKS